MIKHSLKPLDKQKIMKVSQLQRCIYTKEGGKTKKILKENKNRI